jgi:hypothetical protein
MAFIVYKFFIALPRTAVALQLSRKIIIIVARKAQDIISKSLKSTL